MKQGNRLVDVSRAIETYIRRQPKPGGGKYGIVEDYGGHGIGTEMHMDPHLLNYVERRRGKGPKLVPGFCLAIEPMVSLGTPKTEVLEDDWTVITTDGTWSSHWEHSVALTEEGPLVLTAPDGGKAKLAEYGITCAAPRSAGWPESAATWGRGCRESCALVGACAGPVSGRPVLNDLRERGILPRFVFPGALT